MMRAITRLVPCVVCLLLLAGVDCSLMSRTLVAQSHRIAPSPSSLFRPLPPTSIVELLAEMDHQGRSDYAVEGAIIGAVAAGSALAFVGSQHCESDCGLDKTALGFVVGAVLGAIPGLLIGGMIPKT